MSGVDKFNSIKKFAETSIAIMLALGLLTLALAPLTSHYRGFYLTLTLGGIVALVSAIYLPIIHMRKHMRKVRKDSDVRKVAVPAIQSLWISTSMGLGYIVTAPAPYFQLTLPIAATLFVIGWVMLAYGLYALFRISRQSGVPLAV